MRSAIGILLAITLTLIACGRKNEGQPATAQKLDGYWQVTSVTATEAKVEKKMDYTRLVRFENGKVWNFDESDKNTTWTNEQEYSVAGNDITPVNFKKVHLHVSFEGDNGTFVPMGKNGEAEPNNGEHKIVAKRISPEEANRLIEAAKIRIADKKFPAGPAVFAP